MTRQARHRGKAWHGTGKAVLYTGTRADAVPFRLRCATAAASAAAASCVAVAAEGAWLPAPAAGPFCRRRDREGSRLTILSRRPADGAAGPRAAASRPTGTLSIASRTALRRPAAAACTAGGSGSCEPRHGGADGSGEHGAHVDEDNHAPLSLRTRNPLRPTVNDASCMHSRPAGPSRLCSQFAVAHRHMRQHRSGAQIHSTHLRGVDAQVVSVR
jgi:hypothetical protein